MIPKKVAAEVAEWPGAKIVGVEIGRKHHRLRLTYGGKERFMMLSGSPSDRCAENNQIRDVRKVLTELGASRSQRRKATMKRQRNKPDRTMPSAAFAPVKADPWAVLHSLTFEPAPRKGHLREALRRLGGSVRRMVARCRQACARTEQPQ
jgi:hypothetical protein